MSARAWSGVVVIAVALAAAVWGSFGGMRSRARTAPVPDYATEVARLEASAASLRLRAAAANAGWMDLEALATAHAELARVTGDWRHYEAADSLYAESFRNAPDGAGPHLGNASLDFTLHRLDRVEPRLEAAERSVLIDDPHRAAIAGLRADVALQRGRIAEAREGFEVALRLHDSVQGRARLAQCLWKSGDPDGAEAQYRTALAAYHGRPAHPRAWLHLQLGLIDLDAGRLGAALAHYEDAAACLSGWWLIDEHIAEIHALEGRTMEAESRYRDLVARTGNPEFMSALAAVLDRTGRGDEAQDWIAQAGKAHAFRLARFPEAAAGHALDFFLDHAPADPRTLDLARRNHALRPNAESRGQLDRALLAGAAERMPIREAPPSD